jgi:hypothetical protein
MSEVTSEQPTATDGLPVFLNSLYSGWEETQNTVILAAADGVNDYDYEILCDQGGHSNRPVAIKALAFTTPRLLCCQGTPFCLLEDKTRSVNLGRNDSRQEERENI